MLRDHAADPTTTAAIEAYYALLYILQDERAFDAQEIIDHFEKGTGRLEFDFKSAAENFKLIDQSTVTVFIPYDDDARRKIESLKYALYPTSVLRQLQLYAVNIYEHEFENLQTKGAILTIADTYHVLNPEQMEFYYDPATGLVIPERCRRRRHFLRIATQGGLRDGIRNHDTRARRLRAVHPARK